MAFVPIVTPSSPPIVSITPNVSVGSYTTVDTGSGVSYAQILQSLGTMVYGAEFIYVYSSSYTQIAQAYQYLHFDANGNQAQTYLPFAVDPYQNQPALYYETNSDEIVFDGFSSLTFNLMPNATIYFKAYFDVVSNSLLLNKLHKDSFQEIEATEGVKFFDDYCNYLIDEPNGK
jgi:hypothetical protein